MVIGGVTDQFGPDSQKQTFIFDFDSNGWTEGPAMKFGRYHHACANIKASFTFFCVLFPPFFAPPGGRLFVFCFALRNYFRLTSLQQIYEELFNPIVVNHTFKLEPVS